MSYSNRPPALGTFLLVGALTSASFANETAEQPVSFRSDIAPLLLENCLACHGAKKAEGGYRVDSYDELLKPGDSGEIPVALNKDAASEIGRAHV